MTNAFEAIPRDRWGRPMVVPPEGGKAVPYTRCTTYVGCLEDTYNLEKWKMRMTAIGLVEREDLHLAVAAHREDKTKLNAIVDQAVEAARASAAATTGTALHALVDQWDQGTLDLTKVPAAFRKDIEAYAKATESLEVVQIEGFGVVDRLRIGGSWDRQYKVPDGRVLIGDTKTGTIEWGMGKIAMQLGVYSRATPYEHTTNTRATSNELTCDQDRAIVVHLPAGQGVCELVEVDIAAGWEALSLATAVRAWRARKDLSWPWSSWPAAAPDPICEFIAGAGSLDELTAVWAANQAQWTEEHTALAKARRALVEAGVT